MAIYLITVNMIILQIILQDVVNELLRTQYSRNPLNGSLDNGSIWLTVQIFASPSSYGALSNPLSDNGLIRLYAQVLIDKTAKPLSGFD